MTLGIEQCGCEALPKRVPCMFPPSDFMSYGIGCGNLVEEPIFMFIAYQNEMTDYEEKYFTREKAINDDMENRSLVVGCAVVPFSWANGPSTGSCKVDEALPDGQLKGYRWLSAIKSVKQPGSSSQMKSQPSVP